MKLWVQYGAAKIFFSTCSLRSVRNLLNKTGGYLSTASTRRLVVGCIECCNARRFYLFGLYIGALFFFYWSCTFHSVLNRLKLYVLRCSNKIETKTWKSKHAVLLVNFRPLMMQHDFVTWSFVFSSSNFPPNSYAICDIWSVVWRTCSRCFKLSYFSLVFF